MRNMPEAVAVNSITGGVRVTDGNQVAGQDFRAIGKADRAFEFINRMERAMPGDWPVKLAHGDAYRADTHVAAAPDVAPRLQLDAVMTVDIDAIETTFFQQAANGLQMGHDAAFVAITGKVSDIRKAASKGRSGKVKRSKLRRIETQIGQMCSLVPARPRASTGERSTPTTVKPSRAKIWPCGEFPQAISSTRRTGAWR